MFFDRDQPRQVVFGTESRKRLAKTLAKSRPESRKLRCADRDRLIPSDMIDVRVIRNVSLVQS